MIINSVGIKNTLGEIFLGGVYIPACEKFNTWGLCFPDSPEAEERELCSSADDQERKKLST
jgi:hypothetical protein